MKNFSYYLSHFLKEYLVVERNMSSKTIRSYKTTFQMLITYFVEEENMKLIDITFENVTKEMILDFLNYLETEKKNSIRTRNQRLAAIHSFYQYCSVDEIEHMENIQKILSIKTKKYKKKVQEYLTKEEVQTLLARIDTSTKIGRRNLLVLSLLYDTAARAEEIIHLKLEDIRLEEQLVILTGKGNKQRIVPIMENTKKLIIQYLKENKIARGFLFGENTTYSMLKHLLLKINQMNIISKKITSHTFRRSRATHLLEAGVNILYIQELLGHEDISTTQEYAKVIEKNKIEAIKKASPNLGETELLPDWNDDKDLLNQLLNL